MTLFETPRLRVRQLASEDIDAMFSTFSNPEVTKWMGDGTTLDRASCERWIDVSKRNYETKGFGASAIIEKETGDFIGLCGIIYDPERGEPEIIYAFDPRAWGKGYASEVVPAMLAYGTEQCQLPYILATIAPENLVSQRVVERSGMIFQEKDIDSDGFVALVYRFEKSRTTDSHLTTRR